MYNILPSSIFLSFRILHFLRHHPAATPIYYFGSSLHVQSVQSNRE